MQAFGIGIGIERGEKDLKMFRDYFIQYRAARITWFVGGNSRCHKSTLRTASRVWR